MVVILPASAGTVVAVAPLVPTTVWRATPALVIALDERFGEPVDAYVNGSQVWLRDDGPGGITLEWRLHPVAGYVRPKSVGTYEVFSATALRPAVASGDCCEMRWARVRIEATTATTTTMMAKAIDSPT